MKFSIVIPIYNVEKYLNQCVESVLSQTYKDYELILVDDGSPDNCPEICDDYKEKDSRVKVIHKPNGGLSDARNAGIKSASGDYICFIDSDDYWIDEYVLESINNGIEKENNDCDMVLFGRKNPKRKGDSEPWIYELDGCLDLGDKLLRIVETGKFSVAAWQTVISREYLLRNNLFFKKGIKSEDIEWSYRLYSLEPKIAFVSKRLCVYRYMREGSITSTVDYNHLCDYMNIISDSLELVEKCSDKVKKALIGYLMYHVTIIIALSFRKEFTKEQRRTVKSKINPICKKYLLKNTLNKKVRMCAPFYAIGGYNLLRLVLGFYLGNRGR